MLPIDVAGDDVDEADNVADSSTVDPVTTDQSGDDAVPGMLLLDA